MRAINHTATGIIIGVAITNPVTAVTLAFLSHFILDMIPHSGDEKQSHTSTRFKLELIIDMALSSALLLSIALLQFPKWHLMVACGIVAASPDLWWLPYWLLELKGKPRKLDRIGQFFADIQWSEKPWGYAVEAIYLISTMYVFVFLTTI